MARSVEVARINANEDQVQVIEVHVANGKLVDEGDLLFTLETTKAAVEVLAPCGGMVRESDTVVGAFVGVGHRLCEIAAVGETSEARPIAAQLFEKTDIVVTAKGRKLAKERGISLNSVTPVGGRIGEAEVLATMVSHANGVVAGKTAMDIALLPTLETRKAVIVGGGGHAACLIDALEHSGYEIVGCVDDALPRDRLVSRGVCVIGPLDDLVMHRDQGVRFAFIGVGGSASSTVRRKLFEKADELGFCLPPVIHPRAVIASGSTIGAGCHVLAASSIGPRCRIGANVIVNQGSIVCHDSIISDHAHITPGAILAGGVEVGSMSVVGMGATVLFGIKIGDSCLVHNGAHISSDVEDGTIIDNRGHRSRD